MIKLATINDLDNIFLITQNTIKEIYPRYYAKGAVDFFMSHHSKEHILTDIHEGMVWIYINENQIIGTVTIKVNAINRLFVLPKYQGKGYGKALMEFAEGKIGEKYNQIVIDSSLPAKGMYLQRGYRESDSCIIPTDNGDFLCYDVMTKNIHTMNREIYYDGKLFVPYTNSENGEVDGNTLFQYHQTGNTFWAEYDGGDIEKGNMVGTVTDEGILDFHYQHLNQDGQIRMGKCHSIPRVLENGKIELQEEWQWLNGDKSTGKSVVIEINQRG